MRRCGRRGGPLRLPTSRPVAALSRRRGLGFLGRLVKFNHQHQNTTMETTNKPVSRRDVIATFSRLAVITSAIGVGVGVAEAQTPSAITPSIDPDDLEFLENTTETAKLLQELNSSKESPPATEIYGDFEVLVEADQQAKTGTLVFKSAVPAQTGEEKIRVAKIGEWPEVKTKWIKRCGRGAIGKNICVKVPKIFHRTSERILFLKIRYPKTIEKDVKECIRGSLAAGVIAAVIASPAVGAAAFKGVLKGCLAAKATNLANQVDVSADWDVVHGKWRAV
jgi:hypothetical protein